MKNRESLVAAGDRLQSYLLEVYRHLDLVGNGLTGLWMRLVIFPGVNRQEIEKGLTQKRTLAMKTYETKRV